MHTAIPSDNGYTLTIGNDSANVQAWLRGKRADNQTNYLYPLPNVHVDPSFTIVEKTHNGILTKNGVSQENSSIPYYGLSLASDVKTDNELWYLRRVREYNILRSNRRKHCTKQLAIFVKDIKSGKKYLAAMVDFRSRCNKAYNGTLYPVFWYSVSSNLHVSFKGQLKVERLSEKLMRKLVGIDPCDDTVRVYAQRFEEIKYPTRDNTHVSCKDIRSTFGK